MYAIPIIIHVIVQIIIIYTGVRFTKTREENGDFLTLLGTILIGLMTSAANWYLYFLINY